MWRQDSVAKVPFPASTSLLHAIQFDEGLDDGQVFELKWGKENVKNVV